RLASGRLASSPAVTMFHPPGRKLEPTTEITPPSTATIASGIDVHSRTVSTRNTSGNTAFNGPIDSVGTCAPTTTPISVPTTHAPYVLDRTMPWVGTIHSLCYSGIQEPIT